MTEHGARDRQLLRRTRASRLRAVAAVALPAFLLPGVVAAVGLDSHVLNQSQLGEPLHVLIPVVLGPGETAGDVQGHLEDEAAYAEQGILYPVELAGVTMDTIVVQGKPYLRVSGRRTTQEPAIQLLVAVSARGVQLHREYDLLLDPPGSSRGMVIGETEDEPSGVTAGDTDAGLPAPRPTVRPSAGPRHERVRAGTQALAHVEAWARSLHLAPAPALAARLAATDGALMQPEPPALQLASRLGEGGTPAPAAPPPAAAASVAPPPAAPTVAAVAAPEASAAPPAPVRAASAPATVWPWMLAALVASVAALMLLNRRLRGTDAGTSAGSAARMRPRSAPTPGGDAGLSDDGSLSHGAEQTIVRTMDEHSPDTVQDFYAEVAGLLRGVIDAEPNRRDLHLKLLEVYFTAGQAQPYIDATRAYLRLGKAEGDEHWPAIVRMGRLIAPECDLYSEPSAAAKGGATAPVVVSMAAPREGARRHYDGVDQALLGPRLAELEAGAERCFSTPGFQQSLKQDLRAALIEPLPNLRHTRHLVSGRKAAQLYGVVGVMSTREDERVSNAIGQVRLARALGKARVVTSADDLAHAAAVAAAAAKNGLRCGIYVDDGDAGAAEAARVQCLRDVGAELIGRQDPRWQMAHSARQAALSDWITAPDSTLYVCGLDAGPSPYPRIVRHFQSWIGAEIRERFAVRSSVAPAAVVVGRTDDYFALGILQAFLDVPGIRLLCVDAPAAQRNSSGHRFQREHSWLASTQRVQYPEVDSAEARLAAETAGLNEDWSIDLGAGRTLAKAMEIARSMASHRSVLAIHVTSVGAAAEAAGTPQPVPG